MSFAVTWAGDYIVAGQQKHFWVFDLDPESGEFRFLKGMEDDHITDPFWVDGNRIIFVSPPEDFAKSDSLDAWYFDLDPETLDTLDAPEPLEVLPPLFADWQEGCITCKDGDLFRAYRSLSSTPLKNVALLKVSDAARLGALTKRAHYAK